MVTYTAYFPESLYQTKLSYVVAGPSLASAMEILMGYTSGFYSQSIVRIMNWLATDVLVYCKVSLGHLMAFSQ